MLTFLLLIKFIYTHLVAIVPSIKKVGEKIYELYLRGYVCPYPQMYTSQALAKLPRGSILKVVIDNPPSIENIKSVAQKPVPSLSLQIHEAASGILQYEI